MEEKINFIIEKLKTDTNQIINSESYVNFITQIKDKPIDEKFKIMAKIVIQDQQSEYDSSILSNCKLHLQSKAFSGITGSITEKNINFVYKLLYK